MSVKNKLEMFLKTIDPSVTIDPIERRYNEALNRFRTPENTVGSVQECIDLLSEFVRVVMKAPASMGTIGYSQAISHLQKEFPGQTERTVRDIMMSGAEGGVYRILKSIVSAMSEEHAKNKITSLATDFWKSLTVEEQVKMPDTYINLCGHMLPAEVKGRGKYHLAAFWNVLIEHPGMVKRYRIK
ncbi:hypothetical protein ACFL47_08280 [Candidatus Latescibacterota bacterium]